MKKHLQLTMVIFAAAMLLGLNLYAGGGTFAKGFMPMLENAEKYSVEMAELMPEKDFTFKPVPEIMSFAEQNVHTASTIFWFGGKIKGEEPPIKEFKAEGKSKAEVIQFLKDSFTYAKKVLAELTDKEAEVEINVFGKLVLKKKGIFMLMKDHTTHHRGQMVIYLRLKGIKPASYRG